MFNIYVGNLPYTSNDEELRELFGQYGTVLNVRIVNDRQTGRSRGFGFVEMEDAAGGQAAIENLHGRDYGGRSLTVNEAQPRQEGGGGGGGGGGHRGGGGGGFRGGSRGGPRGGGNRDRNDSW